ncbi:MAG: MarR family winged helix-turn-helix transcriptional regulator [Terracidiphilus sp.]
MSRLRLTKQPDPRSPSLTSIGFLLHLAQSRLRDAVVEAIEGSGLEPAQLAVLGALSDRGGMSQRQLGELTHIEKSSMVIFLDALEAGGWVRRQPNPDDRRAHVVQLTPEGAGRFAKLGPRLGLTQESFLKPLSVAEVATLTKLLTRLAGPAEK